MMKSIVNPARSHAPTVIAGTCSAKVVCLTLFRVATHVTSVSARFVLCAPAAVARATKLLVSCVSLLYVGVAASSGFVRNVQGRVALQISAKERRFALHALVGVEGAAVSEFASDVGGSVAYAGAAFVKNALQNLHALAQVALKFSAQAALRRRAECAELCVV